MAERELHEGGAARARIPEVDETREGEPPWLAPWSRLAARAPGRRQGEREVAVALYKEVYAHACRRDDLRARRPRTGCAARSGRRPLASYLRARTREADIDLDRSWSGFLDVSALFNSGVHRLSLNS